MTRVKGALLASLTGLVLAAGLLVTPTSAQAAGESISGVVTNSEGDPVEGLCVTVTRLEGSSTHTLLPVRTGPTGAYTVTAGMQPGTHRVQFARCQNGDDGGPEVAKLIPEWWDDQLDINNATPIVVEEGEAVTGIDPELQIGGEISGRVVGPDGEPIAACLSLNGPGTAAGFSTGPNGQFRITQRLDGDYILRLDDCQAGGGLTREWYDEKATRSTADPISLDPGEALALGDIQLSEGGTIGGTVTNAAGNPLSGICVRFYDGDGEVYGNTETGADGTYSRSGFFPADYRIRYTDCSRENNVLTEFFDDGETLEGADPVTTTEGGTETANVQLATAGSISGLLRGPDQRPLEGACVEVRNETGDQVNYGNSGADGRWTLGSLESGTYRVGFDSCNATDEEYAEYWNNRDTLEEADPVIVTAGEDSPGIDATLGAPDPVDPQTSITSGPAAGEKVTTSTVSFGFTSDIPTSTFECRLDGAEFQPCSSPRVLSGLSDGLHTFEVRATSHAGLTDATPASRSFEVTAAAVCESARAELGAAKAAHRKAASKLKKATKKLAKAKKKDDAKKVAKAKKAVKKAKRKKRAAKKAVGAAQARVDEVCLS